MASRNALSDPPRDCAVAAVWWALSTNQSGNEHDSSNTTGGSPDNEPVRVNHTVRNIVIALIVVAVMSAAGSWSAEMCATCSRHPSRR